MGYLCYEMTRAYTILGRLYLYSENFTINVFYTVKGKIEIQEKKSGK